MVTSFSFGRISVQPIAAYVKAMISFSFLLTTFLWGSWGPREGL